jgi:hypothetical protein
VLQEVGGSVGGVSFVTGACIDPDADGGGFGVRDMLTGYSKATWKACYLFVCEGGGDDEIGAVGMSVGVESPSGRWSDDQGMSDLPLYLGAVLRSDSY